MSIFDQAETLVSGELESSGFGAPVVKFTQIDCKFGLLVVGCGGWIMNHTFIIGGCGLTYKELNDWMSPQVSDNFWIAEPAVNIELNISSFFRISAGVGYRLVFDVNLGDVTNSDIVGAEGILTFKFGKF